MSKKLDTNSINKTYIWVAIIIGVAIIGYGLLTFISKEREREKENNQAEIQRREQSERSTNLKKCLDDVQSKARDVFELNSYPNPQPSYPDARRWDSSSIAESATAELENAKELCAKLYGSK